MIHYEPDNGGALDGAWTVDGYAGIAWHLLGWQVEPDEDTEWSGTYNRTGDVVAVMVGDDRRFIVELGDLNPIKPEDYCGQCGQMGCTADGR